MIISDSVGNFSNINNFNKDVLKTSQNTLGNHILPSPQFIKSKEFDITLDNNWKIAICSTDSQYNFSASWLQNNLSATLNLDIINGNNNYPNTKRIIMGAPSEHEFVKDALRRRNMILPEEIGDEGYVFEVFNDAIEEIVIAANTPNGVFYGMLTLCQLIKDSSLEGVIIVDYPEHELRGCYIQAPTTFWYNGTGCEFTQYQRNFLDWLASLKFNTIFLVDNGVFYEPINYWKYAHQQFFAYARERFIEPIPRLCSISSVRPFDFEFFEGWWIQNESFHFEPSDNSARADVSFADILPNGNFEEDEDYDGIPDNWTVINQPNAIWSRDDSEFFSGSYSMKLNVSQSTNSSQAYLKIELDNIEPNSYYLLLGKAKAENNSNVPPQLTMYTRIGSEKDILVSDTTWETSGWIDFGTSIKTTEMADNIVIYSRIQSGGTGLFWLDDFKLFRVNGALRNVIRSSDTDITITDLSGTTTYIEGDDYEIIDGTTSMKFSDTLSPFTINRTTGGNIGQDETVLISYDAYLNWDVSNWWRSAPCLAKEELYEEYFFPAIDNIIEYLDPIMINIDADEVRGFYRDSRMINRFSSNAEAITYWANRVNDYIVTSDPSCRLWLWDDMVSPYHNGGVESYQEMYGGMPGRMAEATENEWLDKNIIMDVWWYDEEHISTMNAAIDFYKEKGYDVMGSPWDDSENIEDWAELLVNQPHSLGGVVTHWNDAPYQNHFIEFIENFWNTKYEIVYFGDFENDDDLNGIPDGWIEYGAPIYLTDYSENIYGSYYANFPNCAVRVSGDTDTYDSELISINPDYNYMLSAYIKRDGSGTDVATMKLSWYDSNNQLLSTYSKSFDSIKESYDCYEWSVFSPSGARYVRIHLGGKTGGVDSFWYDVVQLKKETSCVGMTTLDDDKPNVFDPINYFGFIALGALVVLFSIVGIVKLKNSKTKKEKSLPKINHPIEDYTLQKGKFND